MAKRSNGEGSVRKRSNGTWEARFHYEDPSTGEIRRRSFYGRTAAEARQQMRDAGERLAVGAPVTDSSMTMQEWCRRWLDTTVAASSRRATTKVLYEGLSRAHLESPPFGNLTLGRVRPSDIGALILRLRARGLAQSTVQRIFIVLRLALAGAVRDGLIARNTAELVRQPRIERTEARHLWVADVSTLLSCATGTRYYPLLRLIATTGVRRAKRRNAKRRRTIYATSRLPPGESIAATRLRLLAAQVTSSGGGQGARPARSRCASTSSVVHDDDVPQGAVRLSRDVRLGCGDLRVEIDGRVVLAGLALHRVPTLLVVRAVEGEVHQFAERDTWCADQLATSCVDRGRAVRVGPPRVWNRRRPGSPRRSPDRSRDHRPRL